MESSTITLKGMPYLVYWDGTDEDAQVIFNTLLANHLVHRVDFSRAPRDAVEDPSVLVILDPKSKDQLFSYVKGQDAIYILGHKLKVGDRMFFNRDLTAALPIPMQTWYEFFNESK